MKESGRTLVGRWWRFAVTGLMVNGTLFGLLWLLLWTGLDYRLATTTTFIVGVVWGYAQNRLWSWRSDTPVLSSTVSYLMVYGVIYVAHMMLVISFVEFIGLTPFMAAVASVGSLIVPNFLLLNAVVFRSPSR